MNRNQYIAIAVVLIVALGFFFGGSVWSSLFGTNQPSTADSGATMTDVSTDVSVAGTGDTAMPGDTITVNYTGKLANGTVFDSTDSHGMPFSFVLGAGQVISGWDKGLVGTQKGEKLTLTIPPSLAYGTAGIPDGKGGYAIPPNSTLTFDIEIVDIQKAGSTTGAVAQ